MTRLYIREWDGRRDYLQTTAEHDVVWSIVSSTALWILVCKLERGMPVSCEISRADRLSSCLSTRSSTATRRTRSTATWLKGNCNRRVDSLQQTVDASKFPTSVGQFTQQPSCTTLHWQIEIFNQNRIFLWNFHDFIIFFYLYLGRDGFPR